MMAAPISDPWAGLLAWMQREPPRQPPEPQHDLAAELRAEFQAHLADVRREAAEDRDAALKHVADLQLQVERQRSTIANLEDDNHRKMGEIRELYTMIAGLERQLAEERTGRMQLAQQYGDQQAQLRLADERLKTQRAQLDEQGKKIAILTDERERYQGMYAGADLARQSLQRELDEARKKIAELEASRAG